MLGLGISIFPRPGGEGGAPAAPAVTAIRADGWRARYPDPPAELDPVGAAETLTVLRQGHDAAGSPAGVSDTVTLMKRVREPYPDHASLSADDVALSDFVYAGDTIGGVANGSTRPYPKPIAMWLIPDLERATGGSFTARLAVAHAHARNGRPVAAVTFVATDGAATVERTVTAMSVVGYAASGLSVPHFAATLDLAGLAADALITIDAVIRPWVGDAFTISTDADAWPSPNLCVLKVLNDVGYGTAYAYVDAAEGDDGAGVASGTPGTAQAAPFATVAAAAAAIQAYNAAQFGRNDASGGIVRLEEGTHTHAKFSTVAVGAIPLVIEAVGAKALTVYQDPGTSLSNGIPDKLRIRGVTLRQNPSSNVIFLDSAAALGSANMLVLEDCTFDANGASPYSAWIYRPGRLWLVGCDGDDCGQADLFNTVAKTVTALGSAGASVRKGTYHAAGCRDLSALFEAQAAATNRPAAAGSFVGWCHLARDGGSSRIVLIDEPVGARGAALVGNVIEQYGSAIPPAVALSGDGVTSPAENVLVIGNTTVGSRTNLLYQDAGTAEVAKSGHQRFNVDRERNTKSDVFSMDGALVGNWPVIYRVGARANAALTGAAGQDAPGVGAWLGEVAALGDRNGTDAAPLAADWADDRSLDGTADGGGDYTPGPVHALPLIPAGLAPWSHDQNGRAVANDGSGVAGAVQPA